MEVPVRDSETRKIVKEVVATEMEGDDDQNKKKSAQAYAAGSLAARERGVGTSTKAAPYVARMRGKERVDKEAALSR